MAKIGLLQRGCFVLFWLIANMVVAQDKIPDINSLRAEESYAFLDSADKKTIFLQPLKLISIDKRNSIFLTLGGEYRARL
ncbi:MAG: hypothetical protein AAGH46_10885, partial [Bacteroidota bacterium]